MASPLHRSGLNLGLGLGPLRPHVPAWVPTWWLCPLASWPGCPVSLCARPHPFWPPTETSLPAGLPVCSGRGLEQRVQLTGGAAWGHGFTPSGLEQSTDGLSPADLENYQHACALACGRASLRPFQGTRVQDSRLPVVSGWKGTLGLQLRWLTAQCSGCLCLRPGEVAVVSAGVLGPGVSGLEAGEGLCWKTHRMAET